MRHCKTLFQDHQISQDDNNLYSIKIIIIMFKQFFSRIWHILETSGVARLSPYKISLQIFKKIYWHRFINRNCFAIKIIFIDLIWPDFKLQKNKNVTVTLLLHEPLLGTLDVNNRYFKLYLTAIFCDRCSVHYLSTVDRSVSSS